MDLNRALHELYQEKKRVDRAIHALEAGRKALSGAPGKSRRGRKMMPPEERLEVSKRMSTYWATRRARKAGAQEGEQPRSLGVPAPVAQRPAIA